MTVGSLPLAISWIGMFVLLAMIAISIISVRAIYDFCLWAHQTFIVEPREERLWREERAKRRKERREQEEKEKSSTT